MRKISSRGRTSTAGSKLSERLARLVLKDAHRLTTRAALLGRIDADIAEKAVEVFENEVGAACWLVATGIPGLGPKCPAEVAQTAKGKEHVLEILGRIDFGIPP